VKSKMLMVLVAAAFAACATPSAWDNDDALGAKKIEMVIHPDGKSGEIEFHIDPSEVPAAVRKAMENLHPGGRFTGAEKEREDGVLYYELTTTIKGMDIEAMFTPEGQLHSEEIEVPANKVPEAVKRAANEAVAGGKVTAWEEIRNSERALVEYHVKKTTGKKNWKIAISTSGDVLAVYREIPAEIEVLR
jgi:uncharacterized membrane protein YkoI